MKSKKSHEELLSTYEAIRARLEEAEETLWAIRNHEVDALVVEGPDGDQVYTLNGAEHPYSVLVETMSEGALTMTPDGAVLYCKNQFSELVELSLNKIMGASFYDFFVSQAHLQSFKAMLGACGKTGCRGEFLLKGQTVNKSVLTFMVLCQSVAQAMGAARHPNLRRAPRSARRWPSSAEYGG